MGTGTGGTKSGFKEALGASLAVTRHDRADRRAPPLTRLWRADRLVWPAPTAARRRRRLARHRGGRDGCAGWRVRLREVDARADAARTAAADLWRDPVRRPPALDPHRRG